jgi:hypothetical protein
VDVDPNGTARLSDDPAWLSAWGEEQREIRGVLDEREPCDAREAFAHFASIAWNQPVAARRQHPQCWAFWSERGLV